MMKPDLIIIGAGAAGLMCAALASQAKKSVLLLDHGSKIGRKIIISGGGRCNFTNLNIQPDRYLSQNPRFCISALKRYTQQDFIKLVEKHQLTYHEKTLGQLFCDQKSPAILKMLQDECDPQFFQQINNCQIEQIEKKNAAFVLKTSQGEYSSHNLVIASGGLSMPKIGATNFAYKIAQQFNINTIPTRPGLVPFTLSGSMLELSTSLAGTALPCRISTNKKTHFTENILFTHRGLSGPAVLQISSYWQEGNNIKINFLPDHNSEQFFSDLRKNSPKDQTAKQLKKFFPNKFVELFLNPPDKALAQLSKKEINQLQEKIFNFQITPAGTEGYRTAEVTIGGIDTKELSSKSMETNKVPGLYFIGEAVDVTGWLGGYNFQWSWSSAAACSEAISK